MTLMAIALLSVSIATFAAVTFDLSTGTGFVGKGDVQNAFGWNNTQLQNNASGVSLTYDAVETYEVELYWETETGNGKVIIHEVTIPRHTSVNASIAYDARTKNQITGFNLTGLGATTYEGFVPVVGQEWPENNGNNRIVVGVTLVSSTGGLYVNYGGVSRQL